ncbi:metallophosphoesterase family protein [Curtobacterium oceanosedimentum]|uniref:metallophosphoesterase family protein n=1 Tax=Curtobacterium oceanosedimentum TaxID=465820 RepID=UPI000AE3A033|nr:metallophosphoesterase [Curtobacterium oceanosedimentum]
MGNGVDARSSDSAAFSRPTSVFDADSSEELVLVAGDWHSDLMHLTSVIPGILNAHFSSQTAQPTTLLHLGDFSIGSGSRSAKQFLRKAAELAASRGFRILITPGNHDSWGRLESRADFARGAPTQLAERVWALPRGFRFRIGGRSVLSFGGAGSIKRPLEAEGRSWWRREMPTAAEVTTSVLGGGADIVLTHEAPIGGSKRVDAMLARRPLRNLEDRAYTQQGRQRITELWDGIRPQLLFHGHHHLRAEGHHDDGRSVYSLNQNQQPGNLIALRLSDLNVRWLDGSQRPTLQLPTWVHRDRSG